MPRTRCAPSPREAKRSGERVGVRGIFSARPPHPILHVATTEVPSPPQAGRGRNNYDRTRGHISPFFHTALLVPAARFCARVLKLWLRYPDRRVAERRESSGACEAPVRPARNAAGQAPNEAPRVPYGGRPPPGAPPWRFWAPVPRFPHRNCFRIGHSEFLASGRSARRAGSRASRGGGCEPLPQDATPRSVL